MGVKCLVTAFAFKFVASNQNKTMKKSEAATQRCSQEKDVLKICSKITGEHSCRSVISIELQGSFIEITLRHGGSPVNLLHIFRTPFRKKTSGALLLQIIYEDVYESIIMKAAKIYPRIHLKQHHLNCARHLNHLLNGSAQKRNEIENPWIHLFHAD